MRTTIRNSLAESDFTNVTEAQNGDEACRKTYKNNK